MDAILSSLTLWISMHVLHSKSLRLDCIVMKVLIITTALTMIALYRDQLVHRTLTRYSQRCNAHSAASAVLLRGFWQLGPLTPMTARELIALCRYQQLDPLVSIDTLVLPLRARLRRWRWLWVAVAEYLLDPDLRAKYALNLALGHADGDSEGEPWLDQLERTRAP